MRSLLIVIATAAVGFAQPDARELVRQSIHNGERSWARSFDYFCEENDVTKEYNSNGMVKSVDEDLSQMIPLGNGSSFQMPLKHDNEPVTPAVRAKAEHELAVRRAETPAQKRRRFQRLVAERSYMKEVPDAFNFKILRTDNLPTGPAWVIRATPRPGYQAKSRYSHMFPYMEGTLWVDKKDVQWVKADAIATSTVTFGVFIARLAKGSHIVLEQQKLADGDWVPVKMEARASARTFVFWLHNFREDVTYTNYHLGNATSASLRVSNSK